MANVKAATLEARLVESDRRGYEIHELRDRGESLAHVLLISMDRRHCFLYANLSKAREALGKLDRRSLTGAAQSSMLLAVEIAGRQYSVVIPPRAHELSIEYGSYYMGLDALKTFDSFCWDTFPRSG